jgi:hypothetical protein
MKSDVLQVAGMVLLVAGAQGAIRLLIDHEHTGLLAWLDAGFAGTLVCYVVVTAIGVVLAGWAHDRAKAAGRRRT